MTTFQKRILTASLLAPLIMGSIFFTPPWFFNVGLALVLLLATWEWARLMDLKTHRSRISLVFLMAAVFLLIPYVSLILVLGLVFVFWLLSLYLIFCYPRYSDLWSKNWVLLFFFGAHFCGLLVPTGCFAVRVCA